VVHHLSVPEQHRGLPVTIDGADVGRYPVVGLVAGRAYFNANTGLAAAKPFLFLLNRFPISLKLWAVDTSNCISKGSSTSRTMISTTLASAGPITSGLGLESLPV
jgi:hypothetical protein